MEKILAIGLGGAIGAISRYLISGWIYTKWEGMFPLGTFLVNVFGSFLLGFLIIFFDDRLTINPTIKMMITIGILGSFTTFSTFSVETLKLIELSLWRDAALNLILSVFFGLTSAYLGVILAKSI